MRIAVRAFVITLLVLSLGAVLLSGLAPSDYYRPVSPDSIAPAPITGDACGTHGAVTYAVATNDAGPYTLYSVTCADGTTLTVAR